MSNSLTKQSEITISIGEIGMKINTNASGYRRLIEFYEKCQQHSDTNIQIDFSKLEWFDANLSAVLFSMLYLLNLENGLTFSIDMGLIEQKFDILMRNGFLQREIVSESSSKSCVRLQAFDQTSSQSFTNYVVNDLFGNPALQSMDEKDKERMVTNLMEVYANVAHARTEHPIFACGQYYPKQKKLIFTIVDLGVGYYEPISEYTNGEVKNSLEAIKWAVKEGNTIKTEEPGGYGLSDILNYLKSSNGHLSIITGGVYWGTDCGMVGHYNVAAYCGSAITLEFMCN